MARPFSRRADRGGWGGGASAATSSWRITAVMIGCGVVFFVLVCRLFFIQVGQHEWYTNLATGQHQIYREVRPKRGEIFFSDYKTGQILPVATHERLALVYADPRRVKQKTETAQKIGALFSYSPEQITALETRLKKENDPYEPIERDVSQEMIEQLEKLALPGIAYVWEERRSYPERGLGGHVLGFLGQNEKGQPIGRYGVEGFLNDLLAGEPGQFRSDHSPLQSLVGNEVGRVAVDGGNVVLTIDRTIQYHACDALYRAVERHKADGGSVVIVEPKTGAVLAMCGAPDFEPSAYRDAPSVEALNNPATFAAYEPGSIFKPLTMAAAIDVGAVAPSTTYNDLGAVKIDDFTIRNSDKAAHGLQTMTQALENSLNLGMIFAMRATGKDRFLEYIKAFGFGVETGIPLETEVPGNLTSLDIRGAEIYAATASFGQGITVTPLQMAMAYAALANGGVLKQPLLIREIHRADAAIERAPSKDIRRVIEERTARTIGAMLVTVIEHGHGKRAGVPGYYIAGKTGTAQVAKRDGRGYEKDETIGSFAGFGPIEDPAFAMVVRIDHPKDVQWAESTAAPLFGEIAAFLLSYFEIPPNRF